MCEIRRSAIVIFFILLLCDSVVAEPIFEKTYKTTSIPETRIIRYRLLNPHKEHKDYAISFTGKIIKGSVTIQIEDTEKHIIEKKEIPAFSLLHWHFLLPQNTGLENVYISIHLKEMVGSIYSVVAPSIQPFYVYLIQFINLTILLSLFFLVLYGLWRKSLSISWLFIGILLGVIAKLLFYVFDYIDFVPTILLVHSTTSDEDLSDFIFALYLALRETAILFLLLGIFSVKWLSIREWKKLAVSLSSGLTGVFLLCIVGSGILESVQWQPSLKLSYWSLALNSIQASHTPLFYLFLPSRNLIVCGLWFSAFYMAIAGVFGADKRVVLYGILIFIVVESVLIYFDKTFFLCEYSSWWIMVVLLVISFFPLFFLRFRVDKND